MAMTEWNWDWNLWPGPLASKRRLRLGKAPAVTAAPRRPRVDAPNLPGGDSVYLRLKGLWNDPGSGRFVKRGRSTAKAQAMAFVPGDAVREVARARGRVRARVADNRMSRSGIRAGDVIDVSYKSDEFGVVEVVSASGKKRKYDVKWARFDNVEPDVPESEAVARSLFDVDLPNGVTVKSLKLSPRPRGEKRPPSFHVFGQFTGPADADLGNSGYFTADLYEKQDGSGLFSISWDDISYLGRNSGVGTSFFEQVTRNADKAGIKTFVLDAHSDPTTDPPTVGAYVWAKTGLLEFADVQNPFFDRNEMVVNLLRNAGETDLADRLEEQMDYDISDERWDELTATDGFVTPKEIADSKIGKDLLTGKLTVGIIWQGVRTPDPDPVAPPAEPDTPDMAKPSLVGRGMTLDLPYKQAQPFIDGTATVDDVMRLVDEDRGIGLWWGELGDTFALEDLQDYADDGGGYPNEEGPDSDWMQEDEEDGRLSVVFLADKPDGWSADDNPDMTGGFAPGGFAGSENSWIDSDKFGSSLRLRSIQYRAGDGEWATIDVPDERRVPIAPPGKADTPDVDPVTPIDVTTLTVDSSTGTTQLYEVRTLGESGDLVSAPIDWSKRNASRQQVYDSYHGIETDLSAEGKRKALAVEGLAKRQTIANGPLVFVPLSDGAQLRDPNFDYGRMRDENYVMRATTQTGLVTDRSVLDRLWLTVSTYTGIDIPLEAPLVGPADTELDAQVASFDTDVTYRGDITKASIVGRVLMGRQLVTNDDGRVLVRKNIYGPEVPNGYNSEPIDYAKFDTDTILFTPNQVDALPAGTFEREAGIAQAAGKRLAVLGHDGSVIGWDAYVHPTSRPTADGWAGPAPYKPKGNVNNGYANYVRYRLETNRRMGVGPTVDEELVRLRELRDTAADRMYVRVPVEALAGIGKSKGLKNQHQSRASGGYFSPKVRREGEATLFGLPEEGGFPSKDRPISGFVATSADQDLTRYGNFAIKIKPSVADRTTITFGDSLTVAAPMYEYARKPDGMRGKQVVGFVPEAHGIALPLLGPVDDNHLLAAAEPSYIRGLDAEYNEVQFHGGVGLDDMELVEYHSPAFFVGKTPVDPEAATATLNDELATYASSPLPGLALQLDDFASDNVSDDVLLALRDAGVDVRLTRGRADVGAGDVVDEVRAQEADILKIAQDAGGGDFPDCLEASNEVAKRFGLPVEQGLFYAGEPGAAYNKKNWMPHAWVRLPDGAVLDLTSDQFAGGAGPGTQVVRPGDPSFGRYWTEGKGMWETAEPADAVDALQAAGVDVADGSPVVTGTASPEWFENTIASEPWYHVSSMDRAASILTDGLDPSFGGLQSDATAPPRPGAVYLAHKTMVDAGLAGNPLAELLGIDRPVTLEFDTSGLDHRRVVPDEDYFTIAAWEDPEAYGLPAWDPEVETSGAWAQRVGLGEQPGIVEKVVGEDNRFAYGGQVPAAAIKRVRFDAYFDDSGTLVPASEWMTPEEARAVLEGGGPAPVRKVNEGMPSTSNVAVVSRDELNDPKVLADSWRQPFLEDNQRLSRERGKGRLAGLRRAPVVVAHNAHDFGGGYMTDSGSDSVLASPGYNFPQLSRDQPVMPSGFGYVLGPSALMDVAVHPAGTLTEPEVGLTDLSVPDDVVIQMGWHDGATDMVYRGKVPPDDVAGIVLLTGKSPIAAWPTTSGEPRWRLADSAYPAFEGTGAWDNSREPIDYEALPGSTVFLSAIQATDDPEQTRREMAIAAKAGKDMKVLRGNGDIVDVEQVLAEYETAKVTTPDDWTGPMPLAPEGNEGNRHAEYVRRVFDDVGLSQPGRAAYTFSRTHDWFSGGRAHAEDADGFVAEMRDVRADAADNMVIRVPLEVIPAIVADGRLKNQHESKQSEGTLDPRQRKDAERLLFGIPTRGGKVKDRPVYGMVETDGYTDGAQYGKFVISLKPETARRSTMTFGDSLGVANATYGYNTMDGVRRSKKKDEPDLRAAHGAAIPMTGDVSDEQILGATQANGSNRSYVEIQVHGGVGLDDMRSVRYSPWVQNDERTRADLLEYAKNPIPGLPLELPQDVYDVAGPEVIDALTGAGVTVVAVAPTGVGVL